MIRFHIDFGHVTGISRGFRQKMKHVGFALDMGGEAVNHPSRNAVQQPEQTMIGKRIVIAGGSGFLGISLATHLVDAGADVVILSRREPSVSGTWQFRKWNGRTLEGNWAEELDGADGLVNLAGRTVDCVKTPDHCDEILRSRVESTRALGQAMRQVQQPPPVWVQMSTAHIYGDPPVAVCDEESAFGYGLAPTVAEAWEETFAESVLPEQRGVVTRCSFVVGRNRGAGNGAMGTLSKLARLGLGGRVGSGKQGFSWIHERDLNRLFCRALCDDSMFGPYIASSPKPVSQMEFMRCLRRVVSMPIGLPAFEWMVRLGAKLVFRTDPELALYGRYVVPARLQAEDFDFEMGNLETALRDALG